MNHLQYLGRTLDEAQKVYLLPSGLVMRYDRTLQMFFAYRAPYCVPTKASPR